MAKFTIKNIFKRTSRSLCLPMLALTACNPSSSTGMVSEATNDPYSAVSNKTYPVDTETLGLTVDETEQFYWPGNHITHSESIHLRSSSVISRVLEKACTVINLRF